MKSRNRERLIFCSGKVYYDLLEYRRNNNINDTAIIRIEQLYPLPEKEIRDIMQKNSKADVFWVQEESANMGAWPYLLQYFRRDNINLVSRKASASPATGFKKIHDLQQEELLKSAFGVE